MRTQSFFRAASLAATIWAGTALAGQDEDAGNEIFQAQCSACHSNQPGANGIGPSLAGVAGRKAGALAGFHFTPALQGSGLVWTADSFTQFLADPSKLVPGTAMTVTVPEATGRTALFTYLATLKDTTAATKPTGPALPKVMGPTQAELDAAASATDGWLYASHDYAGTRFVDLKQITPANARNVRPVCLYRSDQSAPVQTSPLVYQGVMYLTFGRATVAIDAKTCRERWTYIWQPKGQEISPANRGAAIKDGTLVRGTADGYLIALDMADGSLLWSQPIASFADHQYLSMPPLIFGDLVIVGPSGADFGAKNWVGAFKLATGEKVWKFNLIPDPGEPGAETWESVGSLKHGGGSLWTPLSLDAKAGIVYLPVGNPAPDFYGELRPGANLYTDSLVALDAKTGKLLWHRQFIPHDVHDADLSQVSPLFTTTIDGCACSGRGERQGRTAQVDRPRQPRPDLRGADHDARERRCLADCRRRAPLPGPARRHGVERPGLRCRQQHLVRPRGRLVRHLQQSAQGPADHAGHALRGGLRPAREGERLADRVRRLDGKGALEICFAHATRRGRNSDIRRHALHRRS
jgi:alcohol dehydrogenase (cytochrome c)